MEATVVSIKPVKDDCADDFFLIVLSDGTRLEISPEELPDEVKEAIKHPA